MAYGTLKTDTIIFTDGGLDKSTTVSGLFYSTSGDITSTGTISGNTVIGNFLTAPVISGTTVTGTLANFSTVYGTTVFGNSGQFPNIAGTSAVFSTVRGTTITGTTANIATVSGTTITGTTANIATVSGTSASFATVTGTTITGSVGNFATVSGTTVTGNSGQFTTVTGTGAGFTFIQSTTISGTTANIATVSGNTVTGNSGQFTTIVGTNAGFATVTASGVPLKQDNVTATDRLLGRSTAGAGAIEEITCTSAGRALIDDADAAAQRSTLGLGTAATSASGDFLPTTFSANTISYAATVGLDMSTYNGGYYTISLTGNLTLTASNRAAGRTVTLRIICDSTQRTLTVPAGWVFVGSKPADIAASKTGVLSLSFFGTADTDCVAAYGVQT